eukprot:scaffold6156_cov384-Prasinococcus_capsulatus_cf.AAC.3
MRANGQQGLTSFSGGPTMATRLSPTRCCKVSGRELSTTSHKKSPRTALPGWRQPTSVSPAFEGRLRVRAAAPCSVLLYRFEPSSHAT